MRQALLPGLSVVLSVLIRTKKATIIESLMRFTARTVQYLICTLLEMKKIQQMLKHWMKQQTLTISLSARIGKKLCHAIQIDWFITTHYGDWPAPEIFIINK